MKLIKTETGQQAFKTRSPLFSARQRTAYIMFDGVKTVDQVLAAATGLGLTPEDVDHMVAQEFLAPAPGEALLAEAEAEHVAADKIIADSFRAHTAQDRYKEAKPLATKLTASLGLRGFRLNLAVESAGGYEELLALLPRIKEAAGANACAELERTLTQ
ncbi:hypothetical protein [Candidatus Aalborgicola defluviihabitans]|jgi:hypothetical protein|uniref:hypothetical protein n=1 Tax=Candidatus Aalborgicola defluviihabitans TaxID=3386187 RepID=UPI001DBE10CF|nr:hypothetical protein [Burkholderiales bacterium]MBK6569578.1 hypothetical protein [Burkholderiales bacterium]MBK7281354.1 hypothetical protein [Burkholderiales bacterium]MBK7315722.1 hypothetical protein [Burkholderiales bacterium]MBL0243152.1 hypothetical protein [Rhodoferax sp.]